MSAICALLMVMFCLTIGVVIVTCEFIVVCVLGVFVFVWTAIEKTFGFFTGLFGG